MKKLAEETWSWMLYEDGDRLILSVLVGGATMYDVNIVLDTSERGAWEANGLAGLLPIISAIQLRPHRFQARHVRLEH